MEVQMSLLTLPTFAEPSSPLCYIQATPSEAEAPECFFRCWFSSKYAAERDDWLHTDPWQNNDSFRSC